MKIATWNVNSIKQRLGHVLRLLDETKPDVICLQELKSLDEAVPVAEIEAAGYNVAAQGQKAFNGVAILSRHPLEDVRRGLPGDPGDTQARYIEAVISRPSGAVRVASIYLPNGNPAGTEKYTYKLAWMARLERHARELLALESPSCWPATTTSFRTRATSPTPRAGSRMRCTSPRRGRPSGASWPSGSRRRSGLADDAPGLYTFWDYQAGAWQRNKGLRIDHLLLSPQAADRLVRVDIHKHTRGWEKPSDHVPVAVELDL